MYLAPTMRVTLIEFHQQGHTVGTRKLQSLCYVQANRTLTCGRWRDRQKNIFLAYTVLTQHQMVKSTMTVPTDSIMTDFSRSSASNAVCEIWNISSADINSVDILYK